MAYLEYSFSYLESLRTYAEALHLNYVLRFFVNVSLFNKYLARYAHKRMEILLENHC
jgi:hypothetical protein